MRTTARLGLVLAVVATAGLVAVPTVTAKSNSNKAGAWVSQLSDLEQNQNTGIRQARRRAAAAHRRIENLKEFAFGLAANNNKQQSDIDAVSGTVATIVAGVPAIIDGLTQLQGGLVALQGALQNTVSPALTALSNGLTQINTALQNPTTGLVGLNNARPQFGVFGLSPSNGAFLGGTGPVNGADPPHGPDGNATPGPAGAVSTYVVDFQNDVSTRVYSVNVFPGAGAALAAVSVNCAQAASSCNGIEASSGDTSHVLVKIGNGNQAINGADFGGFSVTALSG